VIGQLVAGSPGASDVVVLGLSPGQARSLGETLATAAVVGEVDPGQGLVLVPHAQNRIFRRDDLLGLVRDWITEHDAWSASLRLRPAGVETAGLRAPSHPEPARLA
jgi:hypothetical protein